MTTTCAPNVHAIEVDGDFDAWQSIVKVLFSDSAFAVVSPAFRREFHQLARIAAQSVYYHVAARVSAHGPVSLPFPPAWR